MPDESKEWDEEVKDAHFNIKFQEKLTSTTLKGETAIRIICASRAVQVDESARVDEQCERGERYHRLAEHSKRSDGMVVCKGSIIKYVMSCLMSLSTSSYLGLNRFHREKHNVNAECWVSVSLRHLINPTKSSPV